MTAPSLNIESTSVGAPLWSAGGRFAPIVAAIAMTLALSVMWTLKSLPALQMLRLPDNDDMMRLAQVRDWLGGQAFNDLSQYRLGPPEGASMHWSRIADAIPALLLLLFSIALNAHDAALAMSVTYPALLLFCYLLLLSRIADRLAGPSARIVAVILGALAFPTTSLFIPGRIDHHALQIVLTLCLVEAMIAPATWRSGIVGGVATALSLAIGLETAPEIVLVIGAMGLGWIVGGRDEDRRLVAFAGSVGAVTAALLLFARPWIWPEQWCDGFTPNAMRATFVLAVALGALGAAGQRITGLGQRAATALAIGAVASVMTIVVAPACFGGPYGALDPYLQHAWMSNVSEARGLFYGHGFRFSAIAYGGLCFAAVVMLVVVMRDAAGRRRWWRMAIVIVGGTIAAIVQVRVTYIMAGLAILPFAALLARSTAPSHLGRRLALWLGGAGITWASIAGMIEATLVTVAQTQEKLVGKACSDGRVLTRLAQLRPGLVIAPLDTAAYVIGMTPHRSVAAPYHRNNVGNLAMYRFFLSDADRARAIARQWRVDYVVMCPNSLAQAEVMAERPGSLIEQLQQGRAPAWLEPIAGSRRGLSVYRLR